MLIVKQAMVMGNLCSMFHPSLLKLYFHLTPKSASLLPTSYPQICLAFSKICVSSSTLLPPNLPRFLHPFLIQNLPLFLHPFTPKSASLPLPFDPKICVSSSTLLPQNLPLFLHPLTPRAKQRTRLWSSTRPTKAMMSTPSTWATSSEPSDAPSPTSPSANSEEPQSWVSRKPEVVRLIDWLID